MSALQTDNSPIGIFDSGVGGLTVLRALRQRLPGESFLYLGDTARLPYGTKSPETVNRYALNASHHLVKQGVKLLVVACNTASASALPDVISSVRVPVIGVVEPGVTAALATDVRRVAVIGTEGTIRSGAYQQAIARQAPHLGVQAAPCPLFVPLAEEGWGDHAVTDAVARHYLNPLIEWGAQAIILGCTHYPLLRASLQRVVGPGVTLIDSAWAVSDAVISAHGQMLKRSQTVGDIRIQLTDSAERFRRIATEILGGEPEGLELVDL